MKFPKKIVDVWIYTLTTEMLVPYSTKQRWGSFKNLVGKIAMNFTCLLRLKHATHMLC